MVLRGFCGARRCSERFNILKYVLGSVHGIAGFTQQIIVTSPIKKDGPKLTKVEILEFVQNGQGPGFRCNPTSSNSIFLKMLDCMVVDGCVWRISFECRKCPAHNAPLFTSECDVRAMPQGL